MLTNDENNSKSNQKEDYFQYLEKLDTDEILVCSICLNFYSLTIIPVTLHCGHTICHHCLINDSKANEGIDNSESNSELDESSSSFNTDKSLSYEHMGEKELRVISFNKLLDYLENKLFIEEKLINTIKSSQKNLNLLRKNRYVEYSAKDTIVKKCPICRKKHKSSMDKLSINLSVLQMSLLKETNQISFVYCLNCSDQVYPKKTNNAKLKNKAEDQHFEVNSILHCIRQFHKLCTDSQVSEIVKVIDNWEENINKLNKESESMSLDLFNENYNFLDNNDIKDITSTVIKKLEDKIIILIKALDKLREKIIKEKLELDLKSKNSWTFLTQVDNSVLIKNIHSYNQLKTKLLNLINEIRNYRVLNQEEFPEFISNSQDEVILALTEKGINEENEKKDIIMDKRSSCFSSVSKAKSTKSIKTIDINSKYKKINFEKECKDNLNLNLNINYSTIKNSLIEGVKYNILDYKSSEKRFTISYQENTSIIVVFDLKENSHYFYDISKFKILLDKKKYSLESQLVLNESISLEIDNEGTFVYIVGGEFGEIDYENQVYNSSKNIFIADLVKKEIDFFSFLKEDRVSPNVLLCGNSNYIAVLRGRNDEDESILKNELINLTTKESISISSFKSQFECGRACYINSKIYFLGYDDSYEFQLLELDLSYYFESGDKSNSKSKWIDLGVNFDSCFVNFCLAPLNNKELMVIGGCDEDDDEEEESEKEFNYNDYIYLIDLENKKVYDHNYTKAVLYYRNKDKSKDKIEKDIFDILEQDKLSKITDIKDEEDFVSEIKKFSYNEKQYFGKLIGTAFKFTPAFYKYRIACLDIFNEKYDENIVFIYDKIDNSFEIKQL